MDPAPLDVGPAARGGSAPTAAHRIRAALARGEGMLPLAAATGAGAGLAAVIFHEAIRLLTELAAGDAAGARGAVRIAATAVIGNVAVAAFLRRFAPGSLRNGVAEVILALARRGGRIPARSAPISLGSACASIATGGSVGPEGPIVHAGATLGSALGQVLRLPPHALRTLAGCGAAGGIAAIFNAPIAGVLFACEVVLGHFAVEALVPLVIAAAVAVGLARSIAGGAPAFLAPPYGVSLADMPVHLVVAVAAGLLSAVFIRASVAAESLLDRLGDRWLLRALAGGAAIALAIVLVPEVAGAGYDTISSALHGDILLRRAPLALAGIALLKVVLTAVTLASGGSGGVFAPSLVAGSTLGAAAGGFARSLLGAAVAPPGAFALVGMAAVIAGGMRSPVGAMMIVFELTADYGLILPLMLGSTISTWIAGRLEPESLYTAKLVRMGVRFRPAVDPEVLRRIDLAEAIEPARAVAPSAPLDDVVAALRESALPALAVVRADGTLRGLIRPVDVEAAAREDAAVRALLVAEDVIGPEGYVATLDDDLSIVHAEIELSEIGAVPVVDAERRLLGIVRHQGLMRRYRRAVLGE